METPVTSRHTLRTILIVCLIASLLVFGFVVMRGRQPARVSSRDIPLPFGSKATTIRGQLLDIGSTDDDRLITDMTFNNGETAETFGTKSITFVVTPSDASSFSANAPLSIAFTPGTRFYGYKYESVDAQAERDAYNYKLTDPKDDEGNPIPLTYSYLFPGTFFASNDDLADDQSFPSIFAGTQGVTFYPLSELTLEANARYVIIAEEPSAPDSPVSNTTLTARGLTWCGDGTSQDVNNEQCDNGTDNGKVCNPDYAGTCTYCTVSCQNETVTGGSCGDGTVQSPEACDDGGQINGDGCSDQCVVEADYVCSGEKSVCTYHYSWHNTALPLDADNNGIVNAADVQAVTDFLATHGISAVNSAVAPTPRYPDVDGNGSITAMDVLTIISWINGQCGNSNTDTALGEVCDNGTANGTACTPDYGGTCTYCDSSCQSHTLTGPYCGDNIQQEAGADGIVGTADDEECDVGVNNGRSTCSTECKVTSPVPFFN